jgi:hypothetical protein
VEAGGKKEENVTKCYIVLRFRVFFSADRLRRDPIAKFGRLGRLGCILLITGHVVWSAGIGGVGDSYPHLVGADWAYPC